MSSRSNGETASRRSVPRLTLSTGGDWGDTTITLPDGAWKNQFTGELIEGTCAMQHFFDKFPVALLVREQI